MNLVLIGYRAAGKTTVGRRLSASLGRVFVDTDDLIEDRQGTQIGEIVRFHGWDYFRAIEKKIVSNVSNHDNLVIAVGGGAVIESENVKALKRNGFIVWLKADAEVLYHRMVNDLGNVTRRPSLTGKGALEEIREVLALREGFYQDASTAQLDTSALHIEGVVEAVLSVLNGNR
jgi:shikimate kinase